MKGATAEPCARTISTPNTPMMTTIGHSQYFLRVRKNAHNSMMNDIAPSQTSELVGHRIRSRTRWFSQDPVGVRRGVELEAQRVFPGKPNHYSHWSKDSIEQDAQGNRAYHLTEQ